MLQLAFELSIGLDLLNRDADVGVELKRILQLFKSVNLLLNLHALRCGGSLQQTGIILQLAFELLVGLYLLDTNTDVCIAFKRRFKVVQTLYLHTNRRKLTGRRSLTEPLLVGQLCVNVLQGSQLAGAAGRLLQVRDGILLLSKGSDFP